MKCRSLFKSGFMLLVCLLIMSFSVTAYAMTVESQGSFVQDTGAVSLDQGGEFLESPTAVDLITYEASAISQTSFIKPGGDGGSIVTRVAYKIPDMGLDSLARRHNIENDNGAGFHDDPGRA